MASKSKKLTALLLTAMIGATAGMAGCGDDSSSSSNTPAPAPTSTTTSKTDEKSSGSDAIDLNDETVVNEIKDQLAKEANGETITIKFWCAADDKMFEESRLKAFQEKFADSRYSFKITTVANGEDEAGGKIIEGPQKAADVFNFPDDQLSSLNQAGALSKVSKFFRKAVKAENTEDSITVSSIGSDLLAFPKTSDNGYFLYYDKRILSADDVKDFDTLITKSAASNKSVYLNLSGAWYNAGFFFTAGVKIEYKNGKQTATFNTPEGLSACKAMCHLAEKEGKGFLGSPGTLGDNAFVSQGFTEGTLSAAVIGTWMGPAIKRAIGEENVGASKLPTVLMDGQQKQLDSFGGYKLIGVNVYAKYPFACQTLAYFLGSEESQLERYKTRGLIPTNTNAGNNDGVKDDPAFTAIAEQKPYSHAQGQSVGGAYWSCGINQVGGDIVNAKGDVGDGALQEKLKGCEENLASA